jgi:broad specificity phosphatase PhoE
MRQKTFAEIWFLQMGYLDLPFLQTLKMWGTPLLAGRVVQDMLALLNDVECTLDVANLVVGDTDDPATENGELQALTIASSIGDHLEKIDILAASKANRLSRLIHYIRVKSRDGYLTKVKVRYLDALSERSFGVLNGSRINIDSDLFRHSRITAEDGESIFMVRKRMVNVIESIHNSNSCLVISHPFACQILFNVLLSRSHIALTEFWFRKGSLSILKKETGWQFVKAVNLLENKEYTLDDIYAQLLIN